MKHLYEEVAYLKGLAEGMDIDKESKEGKMIHKIVDVLEVFADSIVVLSEDQDDLKDYVDSIDEDLADVEDSLEDIFEDEDDEDYDDLDFIEMECPNCGELVDIGEDLLYDDDVDIVCPECDAVILSSEDDEEVCNCGNCTEDEE